MGTKAETLKLLYGTLKFSVVPDLKYFTYQEWVHDREGVLRQVNEYFQNSKLAVRSSSLGEDTSQTSNAGAYLSLIGIPCVSEKIRYFKMGPLQTIPGLSRGVGRFLKRFFQQKAWLIACCFQSAKSVRNLQCSVKNLQQSIRWCGWRLVLKIQNLLSAR